MRWLRRIGARLGHETRLFNRACKPTGAADSSQSQAAVPMADTAAEQPTRNVDLLVLVINLDRSIERLSAMRERLGRLTLLWQRVAAIDGQSLPADRRGDVDVAGYRRRHGKYLNPAEVGCYLSHVDCLEMFLAGKARWALILEDDADLPVDFEMLLQRLLNVPDDWDIVKLSGFHSGTPVRIRDLNAPYALAIPLSRHMNSNSILFNRQAAAILVSRLLPMVLPYDHALERAWLYGLRLRVVTPSPCPADTGLGTTIGNRQHLKGFRLPFYQRLPAMLGCCST